VRLFAKAVAMQCAAAGDTTGFKTGPVPCAAGYRPLLINCSATVLFLWRMVNS